MGFDLELQKFGTLPGGLRIECGEYTHLDSTPFDGTVFVPTGFTKLLCGIAVGDITDQMIGRAVSLCAGPTIQMALTDGSGATKIDYIAFGW